MGASCRAGLRSCIDSVGGIGKLWDLHRPFNDVPIHFLTVLYSPQVVRISRDKARTRKNEVKLCFLMAVEAPKPPELEIGRERDIVDTISHALAVCHEV